MSKKIKIICTVGPSSFKKKILNKLKNKKSIYLELIFLIQIKKISKKKLYILRNKILKIFV